MKGKVSDTAVIHNNVMIGENSIIEDNAEIFEGCIIGSNSVIGKGTILKNNVIVGKNVKIGEQSVVEYNTIIRDNVQIGREAFIGVRCILGELLADAIHSGTENQGALRIGDKCLIRSETIIYGCTNIGNNFQTGHRVTIREKADIGNSVRIGTLSDIQGDCEIGDYVNMHSNVHIGQKSRIEKYVWIFPYVVLTNDPNPPSNSLMGVNVKEFAVISTGSIILPGLTIGEGAMVGAGSIVTKDVPANKIFVGNPAKDRGETSRIVDKKTGNRVYPWKYSFDRGMPWENIGFDEWENRNNVK